MSNPGERDDAPEVEDVQDAEIEEQGADGAGSDEGDPDGLGEESGDGDADPGETDDAGGHEGQAGQPDQVGKPRSSATLAVQAAKRAAKEAKERADRLERDLNDFRQAQQRQRSEQDQAAERERVSLMSPDEKVDYYRAKDRQEFEGQLGQIRFQMGDSADRSAFDAACARNPALDAVRDEVEQRLTELRRTGQGNVQREVMAKFIIGERALARAAKGGKTRQAARGAERINRQKVKAPGGGSDTRGDSGRRGGGEAAQRRQRLEDQQI